MDKPFVWMLGFAALALYVSFTGGTYTEVIVTLILGQLVVLTKTVRNNRG